MTFDVRFPYEPRAWLQFVALWFENLDRVGVLRLRRLAKQIVMFIAESSRRIVNALLNCHD